MNEGGKIERNCFPHYLCATPITLFSAQNLVLDCGSFTSYSIPFFVPIKQGGRIILEIEKIMVLG